MNVAVALHEPPSAVQTARILVVEDERIVARSLQKQLITLGYQVVACVATGAEAIEQATRLRPDLVLMDIRLEGDMDGVEAAAAIRQSLRLPVVYLTAYSNQEILDRAKVTEPFGYILKPFAERELHVVIETALYKHRMERRHQDREQWFVATLKSISDAVAATDEEGRITYLNSQAEQLTGWSGSEALGELVQDVVRAVEPGSRQPVSWPDRAQPACTPRTDIVLVAKDGAERTIEDSLSVIVDERGAALGQVIVFRDVTGRKLLEEQLRKVKQMEVTGRLAGGLAHALNNLMTTVLGHSELMLDDMQPSNPHYGAIQEIKRAALRTATLTQKLLAFGRKQLLAPQPVDLNALIRELTPLLEHLQNGVRLRVKLGSPLALTQVDAAQIEEAILTLAYNACSAMPDGGQIHLETANTALGRDYVQLHPEVRPGPYVRLTISDSGKGLDPEVLGRIFEPFNTDAAGMGLAAVYGFVKQCGGDIDVLSQPGQGTTFSLYFPQADEAPADPSARAL